MTVGRAASLLLVASSCISPPRIKLEAPAHNAPAAERVAAYKRLSARRVTPPLLKKFRARHLMLNEEPRGEVELPPHLVLQDGRKIRTPDDLLPIVPPDSVTAESTRRSIEERNQANVGWIVSTVGAASGLGVAASSLAFEPNSTGRWTLLVTGLAVTVITAFGGGIFGVLKQKSSARSATEAFRSYDDDLLDYLDLCRDESGVSPCPATER